MAFLMGFVSTYCFWTA